jgi:uncharacterized protein YjbI with pentapeptide repeats
MTDRHRRCIRHDLCGLEVSPYSGEAVCILHLDDPAKDVDEFNLALERQIRAGGWALQGVVFPTKYVCREKIGGTADFTDARFLKGADFTHAIFQKDAVFHRAFFGGPAIFRQARFKGGAGFTQNTFAKEVDFGEAEFLGEAYFGGEYGMAESGGGYYESPADFKGRVDFSLTQFKATASFDLLHFHADASFQHAHFHQSCAFQKCSFAKAEFPGTLFDARATFDRTTFEHGAEFCRLYVELSPAKFRGGATFHKTRFGREAWFRGVTFGSWTRFTDSTFERQANFDGASFEDDVTFGYVTLGIGDDDSPGEVGFGGTRFSGKASFHFVSSKGTVVDFGRAYFGGRTLFAPASEQGWGGFERQPQPLFWDAKLDLRDATWESQGAVEFRNTDLRNARLLNTSLSEVTFTDVKWPRIQDRVGFGSRYGVADELPLDTTDKGDPQWERVERLYRDLKRNFENHGEHARAGDFHYGAMHMRLKNPQTSRGLRFFLRLYELMSGYGERYIRPLLWAGGLILVTTVLYLLLGIEPTATPGTTLHITSLQDWLTAAHFSTRVSTLQDTRELARATGYASIVETVQHLLGPLLLGLFALAIRQHLRR